MKIRGFRLGKRLTRFSSWITRRTRKPTRHFLLDPPNPQPSRCAPISRLMNWGRRLRSKTRSLCSGYEPVGGKPAAEVPKGKMAVYVGQKDGGYYRILVPVMYCNHPLFGELLKVAEEEYGYNHQGGITIPCPISDFENVQTKIAAVHGGRKRQHWV